MIVYVKPRGAGKTTHMIEWLKGSKDRIMLTFSVNEKKRVTYLIQDQTVAARVFTFDEWQANEEYGQPHTMEVCIDNADIVLQGMLNHRVAFVTMSSD